jgi:hypothetical protein
MSGIFNFDVMYSHIIDTDGELSALLLWLRAFCSKKSRLSIHCGKDIPHLEQIHPMAGIRN